MVLFRYFNVGECSWISLKAQTSSSPHFSAGIVERAKGERSGKSPHTRKAIIFLSPRRVLPFSLGVIITCARVSCAVLSLKENGDYSSSKSESEKSVTVVMLKSCITDVSQWSFELKFHKFSHACLLRHTRYKTTCNIVFFFLFLSCTLATSELFLGVTAAKFIVLEKNFCGDPSEFFSQVTNFFWVQEIHIVANQVNENDLLNTYLFS